MIFCQPNYLSMGGGDGRYGLWLDDTLENGQSQTCETFGNEGLSEEGEEQTKGYRVLAMGRWRREMLVLEVERGGDGSRCWAWRCGMLVLSGKV